MMGIGC